MNLRDYYAIDAPYVEMYSWSHILYLLACGVIIFLFIRNRRYIAENRNKVGKVMLGIVVFQQVFLMYGWYFCVTDDLLAKALPLEMCRVSSVLTIIFLMTKNKKIMDVIFYFAIYAIPPLFYPLYIYHLLHINGISYMINHLMTVLVPIYAMIAFHWRPTWQAFRRAVKAFSLYLPTVIVVNYLTGGNYFFMVDRPFLNSMGPLPFYLLTYGVTVAGFALVTWVAQTIMYQKQPVTV